MIKIFYILLIILFNQSCDSFDEIISELDESEIDLEFEYYIQEGWLSFQSDNYASAATFFNYIIEASKDSSSQSLSTISSELLFEAYHGISWSQVFSANISEDTNQKSVLRENSYLNFFTSDISKIIKNCFLDFKSSSNDCLYSSKSFFLILSLNLNTFIVNGSFKSGIDIALKMKEPFCETIVKDNLDDGIKFLCESNVLNSVSLNNKIQV